MLGLSTVGMRVNYARALYLDDDATLKDLREAATTLEELERTARRVLGGAHPTTGGIEAGLRDARAALRAAKKRRRRGARRNDFLPKSELSRGKPRPLATQLRVLRLALDDLA